LSHRAGIFAVGIGLVVGLTLGLVYAWRINPVRLYNATPSMLRSDYMHDWVRLAALGYAADGNLDRARLRLSALEREDVRVALSAMIEDYAARGKPAQMLRALSWLAEQEGVYTPAMLVYAGTPPPSPLPPTAPTPSPTLTLVPPPPPPTETPVLTPPPITSPHRIVSQELACDGTPPELRVWVQTTVTTGEGEDAVEEVAPLPGISLWATWAGGADRAVTGLRPEIDPGYADFLLQPGVVYALSVGEPNAPVISDLTVLPCPAEAGAEPLMGSWEVVVMVMEQ